MRQLYLIFLIACLLLTVNVTAQTVGGRITGVILSQHKAMESATVTLLLAKDSTVVKISSTDSKGHYQFNNLSVGNYLVSASAVGFITTYKGAAILLPSDSVTVAALELKPLDKSLAGVLVTAKRPPVEVRAGKTVVNVDASPTNTGLNVLEILEKSPGVSVDNDGNVSVKGKSGVLILIDGKPTYLSGTQLASFLRSIQSTSLDQIEIMTNPPAKYDASGNAGVINIKTKKGTIKGMNGNLSLTYNQGFYPKMFAGGNFNYRDDKLNFFGSFDGGQWEGLTIMNIAC